MVPLADLLWETDGAESRFTLLFPDCRHDRRGEGSVRALSRTHELTSKQASVCDDAGPHCRLLDNVKN